MSRFFDRIITKENNDTMTKLVILSGVPGSGKSTFADRLVRFYLMEKNCPNPKAINVVSSDDIRVELTGTRSDLSKDVEVWDIFYQRPNEFLDRYHDETITILDATHISAAKRNDITTKYKNLYDEIILVQFFDDKEFIQEINRIRKYPIPDQALEYFCLNFEPATEKEKESFRVFSIRNRRYSRKIFEDILY